MGHREDLLAGAKRCLYEKGYARTTARDIVAASGTNLASIGYHYGSKEALLNAALFQAIEEWGDELERAVAADTDPATTTPLERFERFWTRVIGSFDAHRPLWAASFEVFAQVEHVPEVRQLLGDGVQEARTGFAAMLSNIDPSAEGGAAQVVGSFYYALLSGVLVQWLIDPQRAPSARDLVDALRIIAAGVHSADESSATPSGAPITD